MQFFRVAIFGAALMTGSGAGAQDDGLDLSGSVRLRYESITNQPRTGFDRDDSLVNMRTILTGLYRKERLRLGAELYDSRVFGDDPGTPVTTNEVNALEIVQAWVGADLGSPFGAGSKLDVQAGRFTLNLGSRRLVAADDYRNTTSGYTGVRADLSTKYAKATAIYVLPQVRLPDDRPGINSAKPRWDRESFDLMLWGGQVAFPTLLAQATTELSFYHLGERDAPGRPTRDRSLDTAALRLIQEPKPGSWDFEVEVIHQWGASRTGTAANAPRAAVAAWFVHADAGHSFAGAWAPRLSLEFDYASGETTGGKMTRFDTLFGMRRADLAPAGLYNAIGRANILTPAVRIEAAPSKRIDLFANWRLLWLASRTDAFSTTGVRDPAGLSGRFAGHQVEARLRWWVVPQRLRFEANAVYLAKGEFLKRAPNRPAGGDTRYLSLNLTHHF